MSRGCDVDAERRGVGAHPLTHPAGAPPAVRPAARPLRARRRPLAPARRLATDRTRRGHGLSRISAIFLRTHIRQTDNDLNMCFRAGR